MFAHHRRLATQPIKSALAIVRLSGDESLSIASAIFSRPLGEEVAPGHYFGRLVHQDPDPRRSRALTYHKPHSFTGENAVDFFIHGSPAHRPASDRSCLAQGARLATRGEFSSRAYLNGRLDLVLPKPSTTSSTPPPTKANGWRY
jgi:tRNA modification GTPase